LELAAAHGARVSIKSRLGEGATFEVDFPEVAPAQEKPKRRKELASTSLI